MDGSASQIDDQELADELAELEQEELNKRLAGAEAAPLHLPGATAPGTSLLLFISSVEGGAREGS